jgi:hypothetical protein
MMIDENLLNHYVATLRRGVKKNKPHATTQRRNEKLKKEIHD